MKKLLLVAAFGLSTVLTGCGSSCSEAEVKAKAEAVTKALTELASKDPSKMQAISKKMMEGAQKFQGSGADMEAACKFYDEILAEIK